MQHLKEHVLHGNMHSNDVIFYYSTVCGCGLYGCHGIMLLPLQTGWMMWNWLVSALAVGAAVVLYDGSPFIPSPSVLWDLVDSLGYAQSHDSHMTFI